MSSERESYLGCCEIVQPAAGVWKWQPDELNALSALNVPRIGEVILNRLVSGCCEVTDCHINLFIDNTIHCVIRFAENKGVKASQIASLTGLDVSCIRKSTKGRYGYRQLLSAILSVISSIGL